MNEIFAIFQNLTKKTNPKIAEAIVEAVEFKVDSEMENVTTQISEMRKDLSGIRTDVQSDIEGLRSEVRTEINGLRNEVRADLRLIDQKFESLNSQLSTLKWILGSGFAFMSVLVALFALLK